MKNASAHLNIGSRFSRVFGKMRNGRKTGLAAFKGLALGCTLPGLVVIATTSPATANSPSPTEVEVPGGSYEPFFREKGESTVTVGRLSVDKDLVTNADYLKFVRKHPQWSRSQIAEVFAGRDYLKTWSSDFSFKASSKRLPVTHVSWFAARAFCESKGKRLLTVNEWEYVSDSQNPKHLQEILDWYGKPSHQLESIDSAQPNKFGLRGMHGLVWEWTEDFSGVIIAGDSRDSNDTKSAMFCGAGSLRSKDPAQYATFMRFAHRSSLGADYVGSSLGFRCARDLK